MATRAADLLDRRMLAALRLVDIYGKPVTEGVTVRCAGAKIYRKSASDLIVLSSDELPGMDRSFVAPAGGPAIGSKAVKLTITPHSAKFMPREATVQLPLDADPDSAGNDNSLFRHQLIVLPPSPAFPVIGNAAGLVVEVARSDDGRLVEGALVRLKAPNGLKDSYSITGPSGEAMLILPGAPLSVAGNNASLSPEFPVKVDVIADVDRARFHQATQLDEARREAKARTDDFPDPDDLAARLSGSATPEESVKLQSGRTGWLRVNWTPP